MTDQAASLRQLKKLIDHSREAPELTPDEYLKTIERPCRFPSILLILLDHGIKAFPALQNWFPHFLNARKRACLWDQAGLLAAGSILVDLEKDSLPDLQHVETLKGPIPAIPAVRGLYHLHSGEGIRKSRFLKHLDRLIGTSSELWITLPFSQLERAPFLVHSVDLACILVPNHPDSIIRTYETVKTLHLSGFFAPIGLIIEPAGPGESVQPVFERIFSVAKKFLSLDLMLAGMITSVNGNLSITPPENALRPMIDSIVPATRDFSFSLAERLFFPLPGDLPTSHD